MMPSVTKRLVNYARRTGTWLRSMDLWLLIAFLVLAGGTWGFVKLAGEVLEGDTLAMDVRILRSLRAADDPRDAIGPDWFEDAVRDLTALGSTTVLGLAVIGVSGFLLIQRKPHTAGFLVATVVSGTVIAYLLKNLLARPRPVEVIALTTVHTASFPSGHAQLSAIVYLTLGAVLSSLLTHLRLKVYVVSVALVLTLLVGCSRVYLGVHYPTDVLAGWTLGIGWAVFWWLIAKRLRDRRMLEKIERTGNT